MQKQAPTLGRLLAMSAFALSCFGILLWLWLSFGGPVPLRPEGYQVKVAFPEAVALGQDADVRSAGITIGTVRKVELEPETGRTLATVVLDSKYAPLASDARAMLRTKTLLGETFLEITQGNRRAKPLADGGRMPDARVAPTVELDEILSTFDPRTRQALRTWQQELAVAWNGRGESVNNALGQLPDLTENAGDLLEVLDRHDSALRGLVRDAGAVYEALTRDEGQLHNLIVNSENLFSQTASERESLAEAFRIFPTFLEESRITLNRLEVFSRDTRPLVRDLRPVMRELRPTMHSLRLLAPDLRRFFRGFGAQIRVSERGLPALREIVRGTRPLLGAVGPFLQELNPVLQWLELHQLLVADFLQNGPGALADTVPDPNPGETGHYLRQLSATGPEGAAIYRTRQANNRGNAYLPPVPFLPRTYEMGIFPNFDCKPTNGETAPNQPKSGNPPACWVAPKLTLQGRQQGQYAHVERADYSESKKK